MLIWHNDTHFLLIVQIGNALLDDETDQKGMIDYAWDHAVISDGLYHNITTKCNFSIPIKNQTYECSEELNKYYDLYKLIDMYSMYNPMCFSNSSSVRKIAPLVKGVARHSFSKFVSFPDWKSSMTLILVGQFQ